MGKENRNMGRVDRVVRVIVGVVFALVIIWQVFGNLTNMVFFALTTFFLYTGLTATCPIYKKFGISTRKREEENKETSDWE